jgi:hypothetical protein
LALALAGCGGGGSGSNDPGSQVPDQPVSFDTGHLETIN